MDRVVLLDGLEHAGADFLVQVLLLQAFLHEGAVHFGGELFGKARFHDLVAPLRDIDVAAVGGDGAENLGHGVLVADELVESALARLVRLGGPEPFGGLRRARLHEIVLEHGALQQGHQDKHFLGGNREAGRFLFLLGRGGGRRFRSRVGKAEGCRNQGKKGYFKYFHILPFFVKIANYQPRATSSHFFYIY